jgi:hypothetical protein
MTKQTIVEFRFPVTDEVLRSAAISLQRNKFGEPYYSFVFVSDAKPPKEAIKGARAYLNSLVQQSDETVVTTTEQTTDTNDERRRNTVTEEVRVFQGEEG